MLVPDDSQQTTRWVVTPSARMLCGHLRAGRVGMFVAFIIISSIVIVNVIFIIIAIEK